MKNIITGKAFVLGNDIDTDQIIPAVHLVYKLDDPEEKKNYGKFALSEYPSRLPVCLRETFHSSKKENGSPNTRSLLAERILDAARHVNMRRSRLTSRASRQSLPNRMHAFFTGTPSTAVLSHRLRRTNIFIGKSKQATNWSSTRRRAY